MLTTSVVRETQKPLDYSSQSEVNPEVVVRHITIEDEDGTISFNGSSISTADAIALSNWVNEDLNAVYVVDISPAISTQGMITVLDRLSAAGVRDLVLKED